MMAAGAGDLARAQALIASGSDVNARNSRGGTALMYAAVPGDAAMARLLVRHGARVNLAGANGWTALTIAAVKGHVAVVRLLLTHGADPNHGDLYGYTPLMRAVLEQRSEVVRALLATGRSRVDAVDHYGATALHHAAEVGSRPLADMLLSAGADPQLRDRQGRTPAMLARDTGHGDLAAWLEARQPPGR